MQSEKNPSCNGYICCLDSLSAINWEPRTELGKLFLKVPYTERSNLPTPLSLQFWAPWHFSNTAATRSYKVLPSKGKCFAHVWKPRQMLQLVPQTMGSLHLQWDLNCFPLLLRTQPNFTHPIMPWEVVTCNPKCWCSGCKGPGLIQLLIYW